MTFDAIVMAGGKGTRLHPYTAIFPKPLVPLGDRPVLERLLGQLAQHGMRRVCLAVNHLRHLIQAFFGDGARFGLELEYAIEDTPLGTCGPVARVIDRMAGDFLLLNGDLVTTLDLGALLARHRERRAAATVAVVRRTTQLEYGVIDTDGAGRVAAIREKPVTEHLVNMGVYVLARDEVRPYLRAPLGMPDLLGEMLAAGLRLEVHEAECAWYDIGNPEDYARAQRELAP